MSSSSNEPRERSLMAGVNAQIDRLHSSFGLADSEFFCECGDASCKERITFSRADYAMFLRESRPVLVPEHADRDFGVRAELHELRGRYRQLQGALSSRVNIEQAKGILAERGDVTLDDAFEFLRRRARDRHLSLDEVCVEFIASVESRDAELPSIPIRLSSSDPRGR